MTEARLELTDELLVAYVDDELDPAQRAMVSSALAGSPALRHRADQMRLARDLLCEAFPLRPDATVPAPVAAAADRLAEACATRARPKAPHWKYAIAASLLLAAAASVTYLTLRPRSEVHGGAVTALMRIAPESPLHTVLESGASGTVTQVHGEDAFVRAVLTFRSKDGRFCREFEISAGAAGSTGIACRENGEWHAEVLMKKASAAPVESGYYSPAGQDDDPALARVVDRLIQGDPLSVSEEAQTMAQGWRATDPP